MKIFSIVVIILAIALIAFNVTRLDFQNLFEGNSVIALIGIVSGLCAIILMAIYLVSKKIHDKTK